MFIKLNISIKNEAANLNCKPRILLIILLTLTIFSSIFVINFVVKASNSDIVILVLDLFNYNNTLPKNFRNSLTLANINGNEDFNLNGIDKLNTSGSSQFSGYNIHLLINTIKTDLLITIIDLRQESHGFINGLAVSWANSQNNANADLTRDQVLLAEQNKLNAIKLNIPITLHDYKNKIIIPTKVQDENQLVKLNSLSYIRIPVRDGGIPTDDMVDYFISYIATQSPNSWIHFHCKQGIGRTTTFMIMYDMIKNNKYVTADEIIKRQLKLANFNETDLKTFYSNERMDFLENFYKYCKSNEDSFIIKWSEWKSPQVSILEGFNYHISIIFRFLIF